MLLQKAAKRKERAGVLPPAGKRAKTGGQSGFAQRITKGSLSYAQVSVVELCCVSL